MLTTRTEASVLVSVELLQELRSVLIGVEDDLTGNLTPRPDRIQYGRDLVRTALNSPREYTPARSM